MTARRTPAAFHYVALLLWLCVLLLVAPTSNAKDQAEAILSDKALQTCGRTALKDKVSKKQLAWMIQESGEGSILLETSAQHQAACWILVKDRKQSKGRSRAALLQRYALAVLHYSTTQSLSTEWDWKMAVDMKEAVSVKGYWMHVGRHECSWYGVTCPWPLRTVTALNLGFLTLDGFLPRELGLLSRLREMDLHGNDLQGVLPHRMVFSLRQLEYLRLHMNGFFGSLHKEMVGMQHLKELSVFGNYMAGNLPTELAELTKLEWIDLYANHFKGTIPKEWGQLKKLKYLDVHDNDLTGSIPREICQLGIPELIADCLGPLPEVRCDCCTTCCRGLPNATCIDVATGATSASTSRSSRGKKKQKAY